MTQRKNASKPIKRGIGGIFLRRVVLNDERPFRYEML
jgi:hypothetical protein